MGRDVLINFVSKNKMINGYFAIVTHTARMLQQGHDMNIVSSAIFCRALAGAVLLSGNIKNNGDVLSLRWNCTGPIQTIYVEVTGDGNARGYVGDRGLAPIESSITGEGISSAPYIELGELIVERRPDNRNVPVESIRTPYQSTVLLEKGEIAEDISVYLRRSLQIDSAINIGLSIDGGNRIEVCGGLLLMAMPGSTEDDIKTIFSAFSSISSFTDILKAYDADIGNTESFLEGLDIEIDSVREINFKCDCNEDKVFNTLKAMPGDEIKNLTWKNDKIKAKCIYCGKSYVFSPEIF